ncbi:hypothetical protein ACSBR2_007565 [Camellia fascicularis]
MVVQQTGVLEINYCPCNGCDRILVELEKFLEVQQIDRDAEKHKASILVTGDPYKVTKELKKHGKKFEYFERTSAMNNQEMQIVLPPNPVPGILDPHVEAPNSGVLKMNYCPCIGCDGILVELENFHGVQRIDRDAESHKVSIFVTGDPYRVTKVLKKHDKKFEYFEKSPPMNNQEMRLVIPPKPFQVVAQPPGYGFTGIPLEDLEIDETIVKKTRICCPKCNHELELKRYNKRFACDGCKEDGFGSRYRCKDCDYSLHEECASPKPTISPDFLQGSAFEFCHQPCSTCARPCYACGKAIRGYFYRCKSKELDLHPYCSNLKRNLYGMDFVHHDNEISSSSKCVCCEKKMRWGTKKKNSGSCSYISTCKKYHFHVYCITEMLHEAWKEGAINVSTDGMSMPPEKMDLQLRKPNNSNRSGGRFGEILKTLSTFLGTIIGILLGDPTGALMPVLIEFFLNTLPKLLSK